MGVDLFRRQEEVSELIAIDGFEIPDRDFVVAGGTAVLRRVGPDVHLRSADAVREAGEQVDNGAAYGLAAGPLALEDRVAALPLLLGHDRLHLGVDPLAGGRRGPGRRAGRGGGGGGPGGARG